jgi:hypothetical protein
MIRLFQNSPVLDELLPVISNFVSRNREKNVSGFNAYLYRLVIELIDAQNTLELQSSLIWNTIKETLEGSDIRNKPMSYMSAEFGELSLKEKPLPQTALALPSYEHSFHC